MLKEVEGNIFSAGTAAIMNPCNAEGVMDGGLAAKFRKRFPLAYEQYRDLCRSKIVSPGNIVICRKCSPKILTVAFKHLAEDPYRRVLIEACLSKLAEGYNRLGLTSVAMPLIRPSIGLMSDRAVLKMLRRYFDDSPLYVEVYVNTAEPAMPSDIGMAAPQRAPGMLAA